ncbi:DNA alkylation repair protein [Pedobacter sp. KR3-3]|uniref:DNA alkylation repair protein n=1 Tax=Pedobacter albus TaxID=3113905 RepID=A0ABU7I2X8_9SPHI|nr:DNA alkylation repair protein [Pedobacter sp. KR3-3]MEE1943661.1 DNA alkylation repair protein [Pedobacter sp. KR3-3]
MNDCEFIISELQSLSDPAYRQKMLRFGIDNSKALGVSMPKVRALAKQIRKNQALSLELWETGIHEARILATIIGEPKLVNEQQIDRWTNDFTSWDVCDQACGNLFVRTPYFKPKVFEYAKAEKEFVKRTGFVLMAEAAVHLKKEPDETFLEFFQLIEREAWDNRNFVKKAVNWALRQMGKRNARLYYHAITTAENILAQQNKKANWIALDALRELRSKGPKAEPKD